MIADSLVTGFSQAEQDNSPIDPIVLDWSKRMQKCSTGAFFEFDPDTGRERLFDFWGCKVRVCPICAWRKSLYTACRYTEKIDDFQKTHPHHQLRFLTLTDRPVLVTDLGAQCNRLHKAFSTVYHKFSRSFVGYVRATDIETCHRDPMPQKKPGDHWEAPKLIRPHIHAVIIQRPKNGNNYVKLEEINTAWTAAMGSPVELNTHICNVDNPFAAVKYAVKGASLGKTHADPVYTADVAVAMHGIRCVGAGGVLRKS